MDAKKLLVGLVTAVTLMLYTGAVYAQQLAASQEPQRRPLALIKKSVPVRTSITGMHRYKWCYPVLASVGGAPGLGHTS